MVPRKAWLGWMMVAVLAAPVSAEVDPQDSKVESLVRLFSPEYRQTKNRINEIRTELKTLPAPRQNAWGSRHGHRSADLDNQTQPDWLQVDLHKSHRLQTVVLVPAALGVGDRVEPGYGFPKRFRVELADNPEMEGAVTLAERSNEDVQNPGGHPLVLWIPPTEGRYLRLTSLKHCEGEDTFFWAIEELMAFDGNINVTDASDISASSSTKLFPIWSPVRAFDSQHRLGMPVDVTAISPSLGYLSASMPVAVANKLPKSERLKWCGVDLGQVHRVQQIRLLPLETEFYQVYGGRGFPRSLKLQLALDENFEQIAWEAGGGEYRLGYPAGWGLEYNVPAVEARYVRVVAVSMWARDDNYVFGFAELQVYDDTQNLALGKPVFTKDSADLPPESGWAPEHLVDGYTSQYRLIEWPEYLLLLEQRARLEGELAELLAKQATKFQSGKGFIFFFSILMIALTVAAIVWIIWRQRYRQRQALQSLREQIARDLHDDIGSNLGGIVLLSEVGSDTSMDEESKHDFRTIHEAAEQASSSMRDIVWLVQPERVSLKELIMRMRQVADMLIGSTDMKFKVEPLDYKDRNLSLSFRRHVFLAFKEVLNNVRKHADARQVTISLKVNANRLHFQVQDSGVGFDREEELAPGFGLGNLRRRASQTKGSVDIQSTSGKGTTVTFEAPFGT